MQTIQLKHRQTGYLQNVFIDKIESVFNDGKQVLVLTVSGNTFVYDGTETQLLNKITN